MRLKKVFAGALAAAILVCAVAVPAFAAEDVEQENCLSSSYVQMNIPYADFYKAAGVDNASEIDAVTSATKNKTRAGNLAAGSYHVNADGTDITGVSFPVKVLTPWALKNAKQVTDADSYDITVTLKGKESTTTYTGAEAFGFQLGQCPLHRVGVHPGGSGQIPYGIQVSAGRIGTC